jgi:tyrosyl-tRNA synthetase
MNKMVPGLAGGKMSSSDPNSKIDFLDTPDLIKKKIKAAFCEEGNVEDNGILSFVEAVLIPISQLRVDRIRKGEQPVPGTIGEQKPFVGQGAPEGSVFTIPRDEKYGGPVHYTNFDDLKRDFKEKEVHPGDLKTAVREALISLLEPIQKIFRESEEWQEIEKLAYPPPVTEVKKKKVNFLPLPFVGFNVDVQVKTYHPPPPGKGKNANANSAVQSESNTSDPASAAAGNGEVPLPAVEGQEPAAAADSGKA